MEFTTTSLLSVEKVSTSTDNFTYDVSITKSGDTVTQVNITSIKKKTTPEAIGYFVGNALKEGTNFVSTLSEKLTVDERKEIMGDINGIVVKANE